MKTVENRMKKKKKRNSNPYTVKSARRGKRSNTDLRPFLSVFREISFSPQSFRLPFEYYTRRYGFYGLKRPTFTPMFSECARLGLKKTYPTTRRRQRVNQLKPFS
jgi:hypothetical protein